MIKIKHVSVILCLAALSLLPGCKGKDKDEVVCPMLYQKSGSFAKALKFIEMPKDRLETALTTLEQKGTLADKHQLAFANKLFSVRKSKNVDLFKSLLSEGTKGQLAEDNNKRIVHQHLRQIEEGGFIYGRQDAKFFATFGEFTKEDGEKLKKHISFAETPTHVINYWHRQKPGSMLIGTSFYLIKDKDSYKIVTETLLRGGLTIEPVQSKIPERQADFSVSFQETTDAYEKDNSWKYQWKIGLNPAEAAANKFELLKLTEIISMQGHADIHPKIARQVLIGRDVFDKYKDGLRSFKFSVGNKEPVDKVTPYPDVSRQLTGWDFSYFIANVGSSSLMYFHGKEILNVRINKNAAFVGSKLVLMSFETEKDSVGYKNQIVLIKTPEEILFAPENTRFITEQELPAKPKE